MFAQQAHGEAPLGGAAASRRQHPQELQLPQPTHSSSHPPRSTSPCLDSRSRRTKGTRNNNSGVDQRIFPAGADLLASHNFDFPTSEVLSVEDLWATIEPYLFAVYSSLHAQGLDASQSARITRNHMLCYTCVYNACDGSPGKCREIYVRLAACVLRALEVLVLYPILRRLTAADEALDIQTTTTSAAVAKTASLGEVSGGAADAASARRGGAPSQPSSALLRSTTHSRGQEDRDADMFRSERRRLEAESEMLGEGSSPLIGPIASPKISPPPMAPLAATPSTSSLSLSATTTTNASPNFFLCRAFVDEYRIFAHFLRFVSSCFRYLDHYTNQCRVESITTMCVKLFCVAVYEPLRPLLWKEMSSLLTEARMCYSRRETVDDGQLELIKAAVSAISELMALAHHTRSQQLLSEDNNNNNTSPPLISVLPMAEGATATQQTTATPSVMASAAASLRASVGGGSGHFFSRRSTTSPGKKQRVPTQASDHDLVQQHRSPLHTSELDSSPLVAESSAARIFLRAQKPREWLRSLVSAVGSSMSSSIFDAPPAVRSSRERAASTPMAMPSSSEWIHGTTTSAPHNTSSRGHHPACVPECSSSAKLDSPHPHSPRSRSASPSTPLLAAASPTKEGTIDLVEMVHLRQRLDGRAAVEALARHSRELGSCDGGACATTSDVEGDPDARNGNTSLNASTYYDSAVAEAAAAAAAAANAAAPMVGSIIFAVEGSLTELAMATYGSKYMEVATSFYEVEREEQRRSAQGRRGYFAWLRRVWCVENLFLSGVLPRVPTFFEQLRSTLAQLLVVEPHRSLILDRDAGFLALLEVWDGRPDEDGLVDAIVGNRDRYHLIHPVLRGFSIQTRGEKEKEGQAAHICPATPQLVPTTTRCTREAAAEANHTATAHDGAAASYADKDGEEAKDERQRPTHAHICRAVEIFHLVFKETSPDSLLLLACVLATKFIRDAAAILDEFWIEPFTRCTTHINGAMVQGWSRKLLPHMIMLHQRYAELVREVLEQAPLFQAAITDALGEVLNPTRWSKAGAMAATEWRAKGSTMMFGLPSVLLSRDAGARATAPLAAFATHAHVAVAALQVGSFLASYAEHALQHLPATLAAIRAVELKMNRNTKNDDGDGAVGMKEDDEEEEHRVWRQLALFASLLDHQDKFLEPYTRRLHRRLLVERVDFPREQMLVQHLQSALGVATTQRLGAMLRDGEATCALQSRLDFDPTFAHLPAPLQVHVMAAPNWPTSAGGVERGEGGGAGRRSATYMFAPMTGAFPILPPAFVPHTSLVDGLRLVEAHYAALHPWRRLTWAHGAGWAMMELHYPQATMEVRTNIIQGTILLHVSEACNPPACASLAQKKTRGIRAKELAARMHLPFDQILKHLDSLMRTPSCQLIRRLSESGTEREGDDAEVRVQPQDVFVLNACFAHRHKQWSIPAPPRTASTEKEQSGSPRREPQMDASIMFALKQQSAGMRVQELHANVEQQLSAFCAPSMRELRMSLERLLDRGYVRRKESDAGLYCYVP